MIDFSTEDLGRHAGSLRALARDLLADEALAEDAVQQACVTALTRPPAGPVVLAAWLRAVVRSCALDLRRSEARRRRREQLVARAEASEAADPAEKLELQEHIVAAVRSLAEPYRTAVWLRYYEDRSPSAIAAHLREPVKTIKTRLGRALQLLRHKLDRRYGDREAWLGALVPLASLPGKVSGLGAAAAAGVLLMQGKNLVVAAVIVLLLVGGAALMWSGGAHPPTLPPTLPIAGGETDARPDPRPIADSVARRAVGGPASGPAAPSSPYGALLVRVRWHDGTPAPDVAIDCLAKAEPQLDRNETRVVSDAAGIARVPRVHAGNVALSSDRCGSVEAQVVAGMSRDVDFTLPRGVDVTGVVVDGREHPVAGAQVALVSPRSGWLGGRVVAATATDGGFAVRAADPTWSLGARAPSYAPSALVDLETVERSPDTTAVRVLLQMLHPGAGVAGTVVDGSGAGISGAIVVLGRGAGGHPEARRTRESWCPHVATTDADGRFGCDGVEPGPQPITAWAEGCTRTTDSVHCIADEIATVTLRLARGVTVRGTVRDEAGKAVAGAEVTSLAAPVVELSFFSAIHDAARLRRPQTRSDADGRFVLRSVPTGDLHLVAAQRRSAWQFDGTCQATLSGLAGDELTWDPVLVAGKVLRVRVVDADGKPAWLGGGLEAWAEQPAGPAAELKVFSESRPIGLHVFTDCADVPYTIAARILRMGGDSRWVWLSGVRPGGPDVELRLPLILPPGQPGEVTGRIVDRFHRLDGRELKVGLYTRAMGSHPAVQGDRFVAKDVLPGRYLVLVKADEDAILVSPWFELQPGQKLDIGDLVTEAGGTIRVALRAPSGADLATPWGSLGRGFHTRTLRWNGTHLVAENVTAGTHQLTLSTTGWHAPLRDVEVAAGQDNVVTLDVAPALLRRIEITFPAPDRWQRCDFTVRDAQGHVVSEFLDVKSSDIGPQRYPLRGNLPFGVFTLEALLDGQRRTWPLDLRDAASADRPLRFSLR